MRAYKLQLRFQKSLLRLVLSAIISVVITGAYMVFNQPILERFGQLSSEPSFEYEVQAKNPPVLGETTPAKFEIQTQSYSYRARVLDLYFRKNNSPLYGHGQAFVNACEKHGAPAHCTLLPAIAKVETDLCKTGISAQQHNCWGFGGSGENRIEYSNFDQAIDQVTGRIMQGYGSGFFNDPNIGELAYCGRHCNNWGEHVQSAQSEIRRVANANGYEM